MNNTCRVPLLCAVVEVVFFTTVLLAVPADPEPFSFLQPDGTKVVLRVRGDEWFHWYETAEGRPVVLDDATGYWLYATPDDAEGKRPSQRRVGFDPPPTDPWQPRPSTVRLHELAVKKSSSRAKATVSSGVGYIPVLLGNFTDTTPVASVTTLSNLLFATGSGDRSMATYFREVSHGRFTVAPGPSGVQTWLTVSNAASFYGATNPAYANAVDIRAAVFVREVVQRAIAAGYNFTPYDQDRDGKVDVVNIIHAGRGEENGGGPSAIWSHRSSLSDQLGASGPVVAPGGVIINDYVINPELGGDGQVNTIGVFIHEHGHALGLPDLYDSDYSSTGVGNWSGMSFGSYNRITRSGDCPAHYDAWCKAKLGWATPINYTLDYQNVQFPAAATSPFVARLWKDGLSGPQYFLVENRYTNGFDVALPGSGLLIWHVDESRVEVSNTQEWYPISAAGAPANTNQGNYLVALMQADNLWQLGLTNSNTNLPVAFRQNQGDPGDAFPGSANNRLFGPTTAPNSYAYNVGLTPGYNSFVIVSNISDPGPIMTADLYTRSPNSGPFVEWVNIAGVVPPTSGAPFSKLDPQHPVVISALPGVSGVGLSLVQLFIQRTADGLWWNFDTHQWTTNVLSRNASISGSQANGFRMAYQNDLPTGTNLLNGAHTFIVRVLNTSSVVTQLQMPMVATRAPEVVLSLADNAVVNTLTNFTAIATEDSGVGIQRVEIALYYESRASEGSTARRWYWDGHGWTLTPLWLGADFAGHPAQATLQYPIGPDAGALQTEMEYVINARAMDAFGTAATNDISVFYDPGAPATIYWRYGASGNWFDSANWTPMRVPDAADHVVVNAPGDYTVTVNGNASVASLRFGRVIGLDRQVLSIPAGGSVTTGGIETNRVYGRAAVELGGTLAAAKLTVSSGAVWNWTNGVAAGFLTLRPGATLNLRGAATKQLGSGAILDNYGLITWAGPGSIYDYGYQLYDRATISNQPNAVFNLMTDGQVFAHDYHESFFYNQPGALLLKSGGANSNTWNHFVLFNSGEVRVDTGEIRIDGTCAFDIGTSLTGNGIVRLLGASAAKCPLPGTVNLRLEAGTLTASGSAAYTGGGVMDWTGGTLVGTFDIVPGSRLRLSGAATKTLGTGTVLNNHGDITWAGPGVIYNDGYQLYDRSTINNRSNATFTVLTDGQVFAHDYHSGWFNNEAAALFRKTAGAGTALVNHFIFNNAGEVHAASGALQFNETLNLAGGSRLTGSGSFAITAGLTTLSNLTTIESAAVTLSGGTLLGEPSSGATLATTGGGSFTWSGGTQSGSLNIAAGAAVFIGGPDQKTLASGAVLNNSGNITWSGSGNLYNYGYQLYDRATINNLPGGIFNVTSNAAFAFDYYPSSLNNASNATFAKLDGNGTTACNWLFNNAGTARVANGTLALSVGGNSSGAFTAETGALLRFTGGTHSLSNGVSLGGGGRVQIDGATLLANGAVNLGSPAQPLAWDLISGTFAGNGTWLGTFTGTWTGGTIGGNQTITANGALVVTNVGGKTLGSGAVLNNQGAITWSGPGVIYCHAYYDSDRATINNQSNGVFSAAADGQVFAHDYYMSTFNNLAGATFKKTAGNGTTAINHFVFSSPGEVQVETGNLLFDSVATFGPNGQLAGSGNVRWAGDIRLSGDISSGATVQLEGGTVTGQSNATYNGSGPLNWAGGALLGTLTISPGTTAHLTGSGTKSLGSGAVLNNAGTVNWSGPGVIYNYGYNGGDRATINNLAGGVFNVNSDGAVFAFDYSSSFLNNSAGGKLRKTAGIGNSTINYVFSNSGTIEVLMGMLDFTGGYAANTTTAEMNFTLGGPTPGAQFSRLNSAGHLPLDGKLKVTLAGGFTPTNGQFFAVVGFGSRTGQFSTHDLPALPPGSVWRTDYTSSSLTLRVRGTPECANLTNGLVAWWPGSGGTNRLGTGDLALTSSATNATGLNGQAFALNGTSYWSVPDTATFRPASLTIEGWVTFNSYGGLRTLFGKPIGNSYFDSFTVWLEGTTLRGTVTGPSGFAPILGYPFTPELGHWYHLAFTFDDTTKAETLYLDGAPVASATGSESIAYDTRPFVIGADIENGDYAFFHDGLIDEVGLYHRALSPEEIVELFQAEASGRCAGNVTENSAQLVAPVWTNGRFRVSVASATPASRAVVHASTNLQSWESIHTNAPFTGTFLFDDPASSGLPHRFYRVRLE